MNCLEFRREKLADPRRVSDAARTHMQSCAGCTAFALSVDEGDTETLRALSVPVPEGLADRVLLRARRVKRPAWRVWALAASVVLALGLATAFYVLYPSEPYARLAVEHVAEEPESLTTLFNAEPSAVTAALHSMGASARAPLGQVRYVRLCPWEDGGKAWHIVFDTPQGLATLILVPDRRARRTSRATLNGWSALVQPVRSGFYVVVTPTADSTERVAGILRERLDWSA